MLPAGVEINTMEDLNRTVPMANGLTREIVSMKENYNSKIKALNKENRYILKSKEAYLDEISPEIIYMSSVEAIFYFKDDTTLRIWSKKGIYNNKTLDMKFIDNVKAKYLNSNLFAERADYSNSERYLSIYDILYWFLLTKNS